MRAQPGLAGRQDTGPVPRRRGRLALAPGGAAASPQPDPRVETGLGSRGRGEQKSARASAGGRSSRGTAPGSRSWRKRDPSRGLGDGRTETFARVLEPVTKGGLPVCTAGVTPTWLSRRSDSDTQEMRGQRRFLCQDPPSAFYVRGAGRRGGDAAPGHPDWGPGDVCAPRLSGLVGRSSPPSDRGRRTPPCGLHDRGRTGGGTAGTSAPQTLPVPADRPDPRRSRRKGMGRGPRPRRGRGGGLLLPALSVA